MAKKNTYIRKKELVREYTNNLANGHATIFLGAGMSRDSKVPVWKELMEPLARAMGLISQLESNKITDYYELAERFVQHYGQRTPLTNIVSNALRKNFQISDNHKIIERLPFKKLWTSNFDNLIEKTLIDKGKDVNVISRDIDFTISRPEQIKLYKVHGCIYKSYCRLMQ